MLMLDDFVLCTLPGNCLMTSKAKRVFITYNHQVLCMDVSMPDLDFIEMTIEFLQGDLTYLLLI